jgi:hypothetical protein
VLRAFHVGGARVTERLTIARVVVRAPAKVNLYLAIGALRDDGYHDLETVLPVDLARRRDGASRAATDAERDDRARTSALPGEENLAYRAARALLATADGPRSWGGHPHRKACPRMGRDSAVRARMRRRCSLGLARPLANSAPTARRCCIDVASPRSAPTCPSCSRAAPPSCSGRGEVRSTRSLPTPALELATRPAF